MSHCNFYKDLHIIYYPNHEETFFDQSVPAVFYNFGGSLLQEVLRILQLSLRKSHKPAPKLWDFIKLLGLLVNITWERVLFCNFKKEVRSLIKFVRLNISFISVKQFFEESEHSSMFKGHLRYKMITSQNVPSKAQIKNFFFCRKIMFHSDDIPVFVLLTIPWFTKSVTYMR